MIGGGGEIFGTAVSYIYRNIHCQLYGAAWMYLVPGFLSKEHIPCYRPTRCCRAFLGWSFWLPLATISYSLYVYHIDIIFLISP